MIAHQDDRRTKASFSQRSRVLQGWALASGVIGTAGIQLRNMLNHPVVLKVYVFTPNFAREFRYNERALVYSGLLAARADFPAEVPLSWAFRRSKDRP